MYDIYLIFYRDLMTAMVAGPGTAGRTAGARSRCRRLDPPSHPENRKLLLDLPALAGRAFNALTRLLNQLLEFVPALLAGVFINGHFLIYLL